MMHDPRLTSPAAARNRQPILEALQQRLPSEASVLEIASGSGEHAVYCAAAQPGWRWLPSDPNPRALESIAAWRAAADLSNLRAPRQLDVGDAWPAEPFDAVIAINLLHVSPWTTTQALLAGAARTLTPGGALFLYGPFKRGGRHTAASNAAFDDDLRQRNPHWGLRDLDAVVSEAERGGLSLEDILAMPANNASILLRRA